MSRFFASALIAAMPALGCGISLDWDGSSVAGSGVRTSVSRTVSAFDRVDVGGEYDVVIRVGASPSVVLEGDDNLLPLIRTEVRGGTLHIDSEDDLRSREPIRIAIGVAALNGIHSGGSSDVAVRDVRSEAFDASVAGSSELTANGEFGDLSASISGSGEIRMNGTADAIDGDVSGSGELDLLQVRGARSATIDVSGSGDASLQVSDRLDASVSGSGDVRYRGQPRVEADVSGSGSVERI
ncbi:MAG TPA: head GIN domain-containing protein [Gemmatimonadota bacterium]|nr:head GIN domain-containing protein [Gemmatimonadota bacterium]